MAASKKVCYCLWQFRWLLWELSDLFLDFVGLTSVYIDLAALKLKHG